MKTIPTPLLAIAGLLALTLPAALPAQEPDFTFTVPVNLQSLMESVDAARVTCRVSAPNGTLIGTGASGSLPVTGEGSLNETFTIPVTVDSEHRELLSERPLNWSCGVQIHVQGSPIWTDPQTEFVDYSLEASPRPATRVRVRVEGQIGWS